MSRWKIAWRSVQRRGLASALTGFSMALGVMLVVGVVSIHGLVEESFRNNSSIGYNMIVGAKGGSLQLVLNTVYYLSQPVENIPYSYYQEFLSAPEQIDALPPTGGYGTAREKHAMVEFNLVHEIRHSGLLG